MKPQLIKDLGTRYATSRSKDRKRFALYRCECGTTFEAMTSNVNSGRTVSCGCFRLEMLRKKIVTHGMCDHPLYETWKSMKSRCYRKRNKFYKDYGARGIEVCEEWRNDFKMFYEWSISNGYEKRLSLDRIDVNKGYSPINCRYATASVQAQNKRIGPLNTSGYLGASFYKKLNKWISYITVSGKRRHLGYFDTAIEAAKARDKFVTDNGLEHMLNSYPEASGGQVVFAG